MANRNTTPKNKTTPPAPKPKAWSYVGPPYPRVKIDGIPTFVPETISQQRIGELMSRYPEQLAGYFTQQRRVKPGINTAATDQAKADADAEETAD